MFIRNIVLKATLFACTYILGGMRIQIRFFWMFASSIVPRVGSGQSGAGSAGVCARALKLAGYWGKPTDRICNQSTRQQPPCVRQAEFNILTV